MITDEALMALLRYLDGECTEVEAEAVRTRLAHDADYRAAYEELRRADDALASLPLLEPSAGFNFRVLNQLNAAPPATAPPFSLQKRLLNIGVLTGFLIVLPLVLLLLSGGQTPVLTLDWSALPLLGGGKTQLALGPYLQPLLLFNCLLALLLIDRALLQPWFQRHRMRGGS